MAADRPLALALGAACTSLSGIPDATTSRRDAAVDGTMDAPACPPGRFFGDPSLPPEMVPIEPDFVRGTVRDVHDGDTLTLVEPPDGGEILFVGARATNMCGDVLIRVQVRYPDSDLVYPASKARGVLHDVADPAHPGWIRPALRGPDDAADFANVAMCPDYQRRDAADQPWRFDIAVVDIEGRRASASFLATPSCSGVVFDPVTFEPSSGGAAAIRACTCECTGGYFLGRCIPRDDGGVGDGG